MDELLTWIEHHPGLAAWCQAVGAILAIGVAIWVPARQHTVARADAEEERRLKAQGLALRLLPALLDFEPRVKDAIEKTRAIPPEMAGPGPVIVYLVTHASVSAPDELVEDVDRLYLMGARAGFPAQQLLAFLNKHARDLERAQLTAFTTVVQSVVPKLHTEIVDSLGRISKLLDTSIERVRAVHNGEW